MCRFSCAGTTCTIIRTRPFLAAAGVRMRGTVKQAVHKHVGLSHPAGAPVHARQVPTPVDSVSIVLRGYLLGGVP